MSERPLDFERPTVICGPGLVIHHTENPSTTRTENFLFAYALYIWLISLNEYLIFFVFQPIHFIIIRFDLNNNSRAFLETFLPRPTTLLRPIDILLR